MTVTKEFVYGIPKAELHLHLEGTLEPELKLKLAKKNNIDLGMDSVEEIWNTYQFNDLPSFLDVYYSGMSVLQTEEDFYELAMAYFTKVKEHNVKYVEVFFDPQAHTSRGVDYKDVITGYHRACVDALELGIEANLIQCFLRDMSSESAMEHYELLLPYKDLVIGVGIDSDEKNNPPLKFQEVFARAREDGFKLTMHCDIDQEDSIEHIKDCLYTIGVDRIDHGTNIVEDESAINYAIEHNIGLTSCPVSNSFVTEDMKGKEIIELLDKGVKITINSDDPAYFRSYVSDDIYALSSKYNLTQEQVVQLVKNAFSIAWITPDKKEEYLNQIDAYLE